MTRNDLRWIRRHPLRWLSYWWPILVLAAALGSIAATWTDPTFSIVLLDPLWPIALGVVAALILATTVAPFHHRLRVLAGAGLIILGVFRVFLYLEVILLGGGALTPEQTAQLIVQIAHWIIIALVGASLPAFIADMGLRATVEAGRDDRGGKNGKGHDAP